MERLIFAIRSCEARSHRPVAEAGSASGAAQRYTQCTPIDGALRLVLEIMLASNRAHAWGYLKQATAAWWHRSEPMAAWRAVRSGFFLDETPENR